MSKARSRLQTGPETCQVAPSLLLPLPCPSHCGLGISSFEQLTSFLPTPPRLYQQILPLSALGWYKPILEPSVGAVLLRSICFEIGVDVEQTQHAFGKEGWNECPGGPSSGLCPPRPPLHLSFLPPSPGPCLHKGGC